MGEGGGGGSKVVVKGSISLKGSFLPVESAVGPDSYPAAPDSRLNGIYFY